MHTHGQESALCYSQAVEETPVELMQVCVTKGRKSSCWVCFSNVGVFGQVLIAAAAKQKLGSAPEVRRRSGVADSTVCS